MGEPSGLSRRVKLAMTRRRHPAANAARLAKALMTKTECDMSDETEDVLDERIESLLRRAETFRELLREGDEITIGLYDGEVHLAESYRSKFERKHAKLFGRMLSVDAQMEPGWSGYFAALLLTCVLITGLHLHWWDGVLGEPLGEYLQNWWFYLSLPIALVFLARRGNGWYAYFVYRRHRQDLIELIAAARIDRDILLVMLRDEVELDNIVYQLKLDAGPFPNPDA